jgi:hypothetical protein
MGFIHRSSRWVRVAPIFADLKHVESMDRNTSRTWKRAKPGEQLRTALMFEMNFIGLIVVAVWRVHLN